MQVGKVCKTTAVVLFVLAVAASLVIDIALEGCSAIFFGGSAGAFIYCLLIYAIGEIIDQLKYSNELSDGIYELLRKKESKEGSASTTPSKSYSISSYPTVADTVSNLVNNTNKTGWRCSKCQTLNDSHAQFCKDCGEYK